MPDFDLTPIASTGYPQLDAALNIVAVAYVLMTLIGNLVPNGNKYGELLRKLSADLRELRKAAGQVRKPEAPEAPEPPKDEA